MPSARGRLRFDINWQALARLPPFSLNFPGFANPTGRTIPRGLFTFSCLEGQLISLRLEDIAKIAGVSTATVSRVVNGATTVNPGTRKRVLKALQKANYHPNLQARSLAAGQSKTIGIIVSDLGNPFFVDVFHAIEKDARAHGYEIVVGNTNYDAERLSASIAMMIGRRVAGLALVISEDVPPIFSEVGRIGIPAAVYDVGATGAGVANVRFDNRKGMAQVVDYLNSLGHRKMAYIGVASSLRPTDDRRSEFEKRSREYGIKSRCFKIEPREGPQAAREATREILQSGFNPTAILCVNDMTAIGVLRELRNKGISVPGDMSVTGFDNISLSEFVSPTLTTIQVPRQEIGQKMVRAILGRSDDGSISPSDCILDPELVVRESTGAPKR